MNHLSVNHVCLVSTVILFLGLSLIGSQNLLAATSPQTNPTVAAGGVTGTPSATNSSLPGGLCTITTKDPDDLIQSSPGKTVIQTFSALEGNCGTPLFINYTRASSSTTSVVVTQVNGKRVLLPTDVSSGQSNSTELKAPVVIAVLPGGSQSASLTICLPKVDLNSTNTASSATFMLNEVNSNGAQVSTAAQCQVSWDTNVQGGGCHLTR